MSKGGAWLTRRDAAQLLGVSTTTLWRWLISGGIPRAHLLKTGSRFRYSRAWCSGEAA